ncbi:MAG TPA: ABC transporter permease [Elusimicrobiales bacterium]|nr:ABC transporter permease [Elusimicrobiales bacterium]
MIRLENISKTYGLGSATVHALKNVSLNIEQGEFIAIMGASGSGKSTLMHILGLLDTPTEGKYFLGKKDISITTDDQRAWIRNSVMGFIFQQFYLLARLTAKENVGLPFIYRGQLHSQKISETKLSQVGLSDRVHHYPNELSGGQQQRAAIARALACDPFIIFADEPTGNLDSKSTAEIMAILETLHSEGKTIIVVTHESDVASHAERILTMCDGVIIEDKKQDNIKKPAKKETPAIDVDFLSTKHRINSRAKFAGYLKQAWKSILSNKVRTFLSMLGILIGVGAVIAMMALGTGANEDIAKRMQSLGANVLSVRPGSPHVRGVALSAGSATRFTLKDAEAIRKLPLVKYVNAGVSASAQLVYGNKNWNSRIEGAEPDYAELRSSVPKIGNFFSDKEMRMRSKVAVIGTTVLKELFGSENAVGKIIKINRINFRVIGVIPSKGQGGFRDNDDIVVIPITTAMYRLMGKDYIDRIDVDVISAEYIDQAKEKIREVIIKRHKLPSSDQESFYVRDMTEIKDMLNATTKTMGLLLSSIAIISLIVGGIGIMNIMLVSVTERTNEIGLRKAIGARRRDILIQFLIEAILLTTTGGIIGILLGTGTSFILSYLAGWATRVSPFAVSLALFFSVFIGISFGLWPAYRAAQLNPIDALRYE